LKSHFATSREGWGGRRSLPYAFTEHGAIMTEIRLLSFGVICFERKWDGSIFANCSHEITAEKINERPERHDPGGTD
jgi:hypothetical protein